MIGKHKLPRWRTTKEKVKLESYSYELPTTILKKTSSPFPIEKLESRSRKETTGNAPSLSLTTKDLKGKGLETFFSHVDLQKQNQYIVSQINVPNIPVPKSQHSSKGNSAPFQRKTIAN